MIWIKGLSVDPSPECRILNIHHHTRELSRGSYHSTVLADLPACLPRIPLPVPGRRR
jgi:hypothetical protein